MKNYSIILFRAIRFVIAFLLQGNQFFNILLLTLIKIFPAVGGMIRMIRNFTWPLLEKKLW